MTDADTQTEPESGGARPIARALLAEALDRTLLAEARLYGVAYAAYSDMSVRERGAVRQQWEERLRAEAKRRKVDPEAFVALTDSERERMRGMHPEQPQRKRRKVVPKSVEEIAKRHATEDDEPPLPVQAPHVADFYDPSLTDGEEEDDDTDETHSPLDSVPAPEIDPRNRDKATIGAVTPTGVDNEDLAGWKQPRNLRDVYARYTIGDGQHFVRVERVEPKVWHQVPCSGHLGDIREPITEPEFHSWYGGRVYMLTVYGPDPRGRRDPATGLPIIKAKTEPFRYTVPLLPPNLAVPPGTNPTRLGETQMNQPFMVGSGGAPTTPADAQVHKSTLDFFNAQLDRSERRVDEIRREGGGGTKEVLQVVSDTSKAAIEQARLNAESERRSAEAREVALKELVLAKDKELLRLTEKVDRIVEQQNNGRTSPVKDAVELMHATNPGKNAEEQVTRMREGHKEEMERIRDGHKEALSALKERHDDELKRLRERLDDGEKLARTKLDEIDRRGRERETELRAQMDQQRRDEREAADRRVTETVARFEDRLKDIREQHNRELRMQESQHVTRTDTGKSAFEMQLSNAKEKVARLEEELEQAKADADASKDPVQVMAKAKEQAEAMGYAKENDEPKTGWDRFLSTAGMGLGKAFETVDQWLPKALGARAEAATQAGRMLPAGTAAPQQRQQPVQQRPTAGKRAAVAWATSGSVPVAGQRATMPAEQPVSVQAATPAPVQAQPVPMAQPTEVVAPPPMATAEPAPVVATEAPQNGHAAVAPNAQYGTVFPDDILVQFRAEVERALEGAMPPEEFARRFVGAFPEPSAMLVQAHKPEDFVEIVKKMPGGIESVITRRDGKRWIEKMWQSVVQRHQTQPPAQQGAAS